MAGTTTQEISDLIVTVLRELRRPAGGPDCTPGESATPQPDAQAQAAGVGAEQLVTTATRLLPPRARRGGRPFVPAGGNDADRLVAAGQRLLPRRTGGRL